MLAPGRSKSGAGFAVVALVLVASRADAEPAPLPLVHPIYVHLPDAPDTDAVRRTFTNAAERYRLRPVEVIDVPAPPPPKAPDMLKLALIKAQKLTFDEALRDLDAANAEVTATGADGLSTEDLALLYLHRAMATARSDWNGAADAAPTAERSRAYADYLRAATIAPALNLTELRRVLPPQVQADFERASDEVRKRPRGTLVVKGSADGLVALDGGAPAAIAGGLSFRDLVHGEHLVRVEEVGRAPWATVVKMDQPNAELVVPARAALGLDDATAAAHARRMGAKFALVLEPKGGPAAPVALRLVDATGVRRDAAIIPSAREAGMIDAAVMRLDEQARRIELVASQGPAPAAAPPAAPEPALGPPLLIAPARTRATFKEDPAAWARDHWPLLTAVGVIALSSIVLAAAASN